jgi:UDP-4-amino-4,6-dideoxy-N-acetyl-beta-L-altrosamine transaminase
MIPYGRQQIADDDAEAVMEVLKSDFLTQGPAVTQFELSLADYCGAAYAVAANSATSALHVACLALGLGPGDRLWTSPNTFLASANCALYCGADVDFVDIDPLTYNISVGALTAKLEHAAKESRLPKIVVPVHFAGQSCEMRAIRELADHYGFYILEDASHAVGAEYLGEPVGSCRYSDITVFSFHPVKVITTGEGGLALSNNADLASAMKRFCSHGVVRDPIDMVYTPHGPWYYEQVELGYNYRMTDIQAALGLSQLLRLDQFILKRREIAHRYNAELAHLPITKPWQSSDANSAHHLYVIHIDVKVAKVSRLEVFQHMRDEGIGVNVHYIPVHTHPFYQNRGFKVGDFPCAEKHYAQAISLPIFPALTIAQQKEVISALCRALE